MSTPDSMQHSPLEGLTERLIADLDLTREEIRVAARELADETVSEEDKAVFLVALKTKGETGEELGYFAEAFTSLAIRPRFPLGDQPTMDLCGTGGDRLEMINVSTIASFIVAAAGVVVLKHGNRAITSKSGGTDLLEQLGIPANCPIHVVERCVQEAGLGFLFAPLYHPAFRIVAPIRRKLAEQGHATIFNLLGPLLNPARPQYQLVGVFAPTVLEKYAVALSRLGRRRAWVVHGHVPAGSGMDEISTLGETLVYEVKGEAATPFSLFPDQFGLSPVSLHELRAGGPVASAQAALQILGRQDRGPRRDLVLLNAGAALTVAGLTPRVEDGLRRAAELVDSGAALERLHTVQRFYREEIG
ncbi:MAG: anthranilate phosphoribosyltransferase [Verrucomicrobia bacterium]|nr:anthranilate phosphoribosyltransferase [Verrucomicrobiota bacterium]